MSVTLLGVVIAQLDFSALGVHWHKFSPLVVLACLAILALEITVIAGARLKLVLETRGARLPITRTAQIALCGFFLEQVAFGFVGGDAMRLWLLHRLDVPVRTGLEVLVIDRVLGLIGLLLLVVVGLSGLLGVAPGLAYRSTFMLGGGALVLVIAVVLWVRGTPGRQRGYSVLSDVSAFLSAAIREPAVRGRLLTVLGLAIVVHAMNVLFMFLIGHAMGLPVSFRQWFAIVPAALLFSMIPVSAGGWGLREGVLLFSLRSLGARPEDAVIPSIVFGLGMLLVTLPGAVIWLWYRRPSRSGEPVTPLEVAPRAFR